MEQAFINLYLVDAYILDPWTIIHFLTWSWLGYFCVKQKSNMLGCVVFALLTGVAWEVLESLVVEPLLNFREPDWNRRADLLADVLGAITGYWVANKGIK